MRKQHIDVASSGTTGTIIPLILPAIKVALLVGSVLILINQFDAIFGEQSFRWLPVILTYCVPFSVFLAGRVSANSDHKPT